jgi:hypothetical protein
MLRAVRDLPRDAGRTWRLALAPRVVLGGLMARGDRTLTPRRNAVIGTRVSIRQLAELMASREDIAFDESEIDAHKNLILQPLLDATIKFLKAKGVDVSGFEGQVTTIINASVYNAGTFTVEKSAIGDHAAFNEGQPEKTPNTSGGEK